MHTETTNTDKASPAATVGLAKEICDSRHRSAEQIYLTHCIRSDGWKNEEGFNIRASSTNDPQLLRFIHDFPGHEIPLDMWRLDPKPDQAPRRLATVRLKDGRTALVHSSYVEWDTCTPPRRGSYFTHVLVYDSLSLSEAVSSWGSKDWVTEYPQGATQKLDRFIGLPCPGPLNDDQLANFLTDTGRPPLTQNLATVYYPDRTSADVKKRRELVRLVLHAWCVLKSGSGAPRSRLYVLAEPGLVALLLYGLARLLPPTLTRDLTFSTYESPHASLRSYQLGTVIGTYMHNPGKSLDHELAITRGYGLETFGDALTSFDLQRCPTELRYAPTPVFDELLNLTADREWDALKDLQELWHRYAVESHTLGEALSVRTSYHNLKTGQFRLEDMRSLKRTFLGRRLLGEYEETVWRNLCEWGLSEPSLGPEFTAEFSPHYQELTDYVCSKVHEASTKRWQQHWALLKSLNSSSPEKSRQLLLGMIDKALQGRERSPLPHSARRSLLVEACNTLERTELSLDNMPKTLKALLIPHAGEELEDLLREQLPGAWHGYSLVRSVEQPTLTELGVRLLRGSGEHLVREFCDALSHESEPRQIQLLVNCFVQHSQRPHEFYELLRKNGLQVAPDVLDSFLQKIGASRGPWRHYWLQGTNLRDIMRDLGKGAVITAQLWDGYLRSLNASLLLGDKMQLSLFERLCTVDRELEKLVPEAAHEILLDWSTLYNHLHTDTQCATDPRELNSSCERLNLRLLDLLRNYYHQVVRAPKATPDRVNAFLRKFRCFYQADEEIAQGLMLEGWLEVLRGSLPAERLIGERLFFQYVPSDVLRRELAAEYQGHLTKDVYEEMSRQPASADDSDDQEGYSIAAEPTITLNCGRRRKKKTHRREKSIVSSRFRALLWALLIVAVVMIGLGFALWYYVRHREIGPEQSTPRTSQRLSVPGQIQTLAQGHSECTLPFVIVRSFDLSRGQTDPRLL